MPAITVTDLNNAKTDVDHIAAIATSAALTATDRLGNTKNTMAGAIATISAITNRGAWATATIYASKDLVSDSGTWYICVAPHTSAALFATDAANWRVYQGVMDADLSSTANGKGASTVGIEDAGGYFTATTVEGALAEIGEGIHTISAAPFGFLTTATAAANKLALQAAIDFLGATGGQIDIPRGTYSVDPGIVILDTQKNITISGAGNAMAYEGAAAGTQIVFTAGTIGFDLTSVTQNGTKYATLRNMSISGADVCATGIKISGICTVEYVNVTACTFAGIWLFDYINQTRLDHVSSCYNTAASSYGLLVGGTGSTGNNTIFSVEHCTFRRNLVGVRITNGIHFRFSDCVIESNYGTGMEVYKPTGVNCEYGQFDLCHFEYNNFGTSLYNLTIDSQTYNYAGGPPFGFVFSNCHFATSGSTKAINAVAMRNGTFRHVNGTGAIDLGTYCSTTRLESMNAGTITDNGNRNFQIDHDASTAGGLLLTRQIREPSKAASYVWTAWNPSDRASTATTAGATGTATLGPDNFVLANASGTATLTFQHPGKYLITAMVAFSAGAVYTGGDMFINLGGTATRHTPLTQYAFTGDAANSTNFTGTISFLVTSTTANETLTVQPQGRVTAAAGAVSSWTLNAGLTALFVGS